MDFDKETFEQLLNTDEGQAFLAKEKQGLVNKKDELLGKLTATQEQLRQYKVLGELDELKTVLQNDKPVEVKDDDWQAKEQYLNEQLNQKNKALDDVKSMLINEKVTATLQASIAKQRGDVNVLLPLLSQQVKGDLTENGVSVSVYENGQVVHVEGERMTVDQLVEQAKTKHPVLFEMMASGTGTRPNSTVVKDSVTYDFNDTNFNLSKAAEKVKKTGQYTSITKKFGWR